MIWWSPPIRAAADAPFTPERSPMPTSTRIAPHFVARSELETVEVLGSDVQFITPPAEVGERFCLMRGAIQAGAAVPLHSHASYETFTVISGEFEAFPADDDQPGWRPVRAGDADATAAHATVGS
jgi:anti-sigma factor ChrR (cupin superfamily)